MHSRGINSKKQRVVPRFEFGHILWISTDISKNKIICQLGIYHSTFA